MSGIASITATPNLVFGSYNVTAIVGALTATFALTNAVPTPNASAFLNQQNSVWVSWISWAALGANYEVARLAADGVWVTLGTTTVGQFFDNTVVENGAYLYKVRAIAPMVMPYGAADLATTVFFTDPGSTTIVKAAHFTELRTAVNAVRALAGLTAYPFTDATLTGMTIKAVHITELRTAVNAVRVLAGLPAATFTDATITPGVTTPKAAHVTELRSNLDTARSTLALPAQSYTDPTIVAGSTVIKAQHILDLRNGVQ